MPIPIEQENIIKLLGIEALEDERKIALVEKVTDLVQKRLLVRLLDGLPAEKQAELTRLLEQEDQVVLNTFLEKEAPDLATWAAREVGKIKHELAGLVKNI